MAESFFGATILTEQEQLGSRPIFGVSLGILNKKDLREAKNFDKDFEKYNVELFRDVTAEIHKYLIRLTPIHTGKLRGGWTAFLDKYRIDYSKQIKDTSLYDAWKAANKSPEHQEYAIDSTSIEEGKKDSVLEDKLPKSTEVAVFNFVPYKEFLEFGTTEIEGRHFSERARYRGEEHITKSYERWLKKMEKAGKVVSPPEAGEIK